MSSIHGKIEKQYRFVLPVNCPVSFEGSYGYIRYYVKGRIDRPWYKFDKTTKRVFSVIPPSDLNFIPNTSLPIQASDSKETGVLFFKSGRINMTVKIHKGGFVPGEAIALEADIANASKKKIKTIRVKIVQCSHYVAYRDGGTVNAAGVQVSGWSKHPKRKESHREVFSSEERVEILKGASEKFTRMVRIPPVVATFNNCPIISVEYFLKIKVTTNETFSTNLSARLPIVIGTIPLRQVPLPSVPLPELGAPPVYPQIPPLDLPPPSYADCVLGAGTVKGADETNNFTPRYAFYPNITPTAPPLETEKL